MTLKFVSMLMVPVALSAVLVTPALAQHGHGHGYGHQRHRHARVNNWNNDRAMYRQRWNRMSVAQQRRIDAQMRAQYLAYHHNRYNGAYTWNNYSDPAFLDYLHTRNPGLLTTIRGYLGF